MSDEIKDIMERAREMIASLQESNDLRQTHLDSFVFARYAHALRQNEPIIWPQLLAQAEDDLEGFTQAIMEAL